MIRTGGIQMTISTNPGRLINSAILVFLNTCAVLALCSCLQSPQPGDTAGSGTELGNVIGSVFTPDNLPAQGVEVVLYPVDGDTTRIRKARADAAGAFSFQSVRGAYRMITLDGLGNGLTVDSINPEGNMRIDLSRRTLAPLGGLSAYVKVGNAQGFKAELSLQGTPFSLQAEANAGFDWQGLPAGKYWLHAYYPGSKSLEVPISIAPGATTVLADTLNLDFQYSFGISRTDTLVLSTDQLPYRISDKVYAADEDVDTIYFLLNGKKVEMIPSHIRVPTCEIRRDMLNDSGANLLELRILLKDTAIARQWFITLDDKRITPWPHQAVRAVFLGEQPNPRPDPDSPELGTFRILQRKILGVDDLGYFGWQPIAETDSAMPEEITIPVNIKQGFGYFGCKGPENKGPAITQFPGDTVTFLIRSDSTSKGRAFMVRSGQRFEDYGNLRFWAKAEWPLAGMFPDFYDKLTFLDLSARPGSLDFRFYGDRMINDSSYTCLPVVLRFTMDSTGMVRENLAVPPGFNERVLLLHYRTDVSQGIISEEMPTRGSYVYIDSSGKGIAGAGSTTREFQLSGSDVAELKAMLASVPAPMSAAWEADYLENNHSNSVDSIRYLFTGGRSAVFFLDAENPLPEKAVLFGDVETWLRAKGWL